MHFLGYLTVCAGKRQTVLVLFLFCMTKAEVWRGQECGPSSSVTLQSQPRGLKRVLVLHINSPIHKTQINSDLSPSQGGKCSKDKPSKYFWYSTCEWWSWNKYFPWSCWWQSTRQGLTWGLCAQWDNDCIRLLRQNETKTSPFFFVSGRLLVCSHDQVTFSAAQKAPGCAQLCQGRQEGLLVPSQGTTWC